MLATGCDQRICRQCLTPKPLTEFRLRRKDCELRQHVCNKCHRAEEKTRRTQQRERHERRTMQGLVAGIKSARDVRRIMAMAQAAEEKLGSPDDFARLWKRHLDAACNLPDGHRRVCDLLCSVVRLNVAANELLPKPDYGRMTDQELEQELRDLEVRRLTERLPEVLETLLDLGWKIEPPECDDAGDSEPLRTT